MKKSRFQPRRSMLRKSFLVLASVVLVLASIVAAPSVGGIDRGQPEQQQSMDNMAHFVKRAKRIDLLPKQTSFNGDPALIRSKIKALLTEAQNMLNQVKNPNSRDWLQSFVRQLSALVSESIPNGPPEYGRIVSGKRDIATTPEPEVAQSENSLSAVHSTALSILPTTPQYSQMAVQIPTSTPTIVGVEKREPLEPKPLQQVPKETVVQEEPGKLEVQHVVAEPEDDELVRELEELPRLAALEKERLHHVNKTLESNEIPAHVQTESKLPSPPNKSPESNEIPAHVQTESNSSLPPNKTPESNEIPAHVQTESDSSSPPKRVPSPVEYQRVVDAEKSRIKENVQKEVDELQRLGESKDQIAQELHLNDFKQESMKKVPQFGPYPYGDRAFYQGPAYGRGAYHHVNDVTNNDRMISHAWRVPMVQPMYYAPRPMYGNSTHYAMPMNIRTHQVHYPFVPTKYSMMPNVADWQRQQGIKTRLQQISERRQKYLKGETNGNPQLGQNDQAANFPSGGNPHNAFAGNMTNTGQSPLPDPQANQSGELTEEMKRELRDGKVILVSDDKIRSNFSTDPGK